MDLERDVVEMDDIHFGLGMELGSLSTAIGGDDGEPVTDDAHHGDSPAPAYHSIEKGQQGQHGSNCEEDGGVQGIRVEVEKAMSLDL